MAEIDEKEKRRRKQAKRMTKILSHVWGLPHSDLFHDEPNIQEKNITPGGSVFDLTTVGQKIDGHHYRLGKHGWEDFARDLGGVYNRHVQRKTKYAKTAKQHLEEVKKMLSKDPSLANLATSHVPNEDEFIKQLKKKAAASAATHSNSGTNNHKHHHHGEKNNHKHSTSGSSDKKRKAGSSTKSAKYLDQAKSNKTDLSLGERENLSLKALGCFVEENGGSEDQISSFTARVTRKQSKYDILFFNDGGRKFRNMTEVGRFLDIIRAPKRVKNTSSTNNHKRNTSAINKEIQAEKKKLRKELDKLRRAHQKAAKALDEFFNDEKQSRYHVEDLSLLEKDSQQNQQTSQSSSVIAAEAASATVENSTDLSFYSPSSLLLQKRAYRKKCAATRARDIDGFPGIPSTCIPDLLMSWDFLCTFQRLLSLNPIGLDDFANALIYNPPQSVQGDDVQSPPVYLAEAHMGLLKLLFQDRTSDDWWWSILETDETELNNVNGLLNKKSEKGGDDDKDSENDDDDDDDDDANDDSSDVDTSISNKRGPVIKIDMAALLAQTEDRLITTSWLQALEDVRKVKLQDPNKKLSNNVEVNNDKKSKKAIINSIKEPIKTAKALVANKYVVAYLRKVLQNAKNDTILAKYAVTWLIDRFMDARPDLWNEKVREELVNKSRASTVEHVTQQMEKLDNNTAIAIVTDDDVSSDLESDDEEDDDDDDDDSDDEDYMEDDDNDGDDKNKEDQLVNGRRKMTKGSSSTTSQEEENRPSTVIPPRPPPTLADLLLPPLKPRHNADFLNPFTWPHLAGATAHRILHRFKRLRNEADDSLRAFRQLPILTQKERRQREAIAASRVLTECASAKVDGDENEADPCTRAIEHLCLGKKYLDLSPLERLCIIRLLIEAAYDTERVYQTVDSNYEQRISAMKALDAEQRRAKREAKEKVIADEMAAREQLAVEARNKFLDEKRMEIRGGNEGSNEYTEEFLDSLTDEDIIEFDEDIKADYDALPGPESFSKNEVTEMVTRMQEEAAFETHSVRILSMEEIIEQERVEIEEMEAQLHSLTGGEDDIDTLLLDPSIDRETSRSIERLRREIDKAKQFQVARPADREIALETLRDAIADGTIKVLKNAIRIAKQAKLSGPDSETGGVWTIGLLRDAALELVNAQQLKRVADAQKDLIAKRNKCFIRNEPIGLDRFRNRFWHFDNDEQGHIWVESKHMVLNDGSEEDKDHHLPTVQFGYLDLVVDEIKSISIGAGELEEDFAHSTKDFLLFSRREHHSCGLASTLVKYKWGSQATEESIRAMIKDLDSKGTREDALKASLKELLEVETGVPSVDNHNSHKHDGSKDVSNDNDNDGGGDGDGGGDNEDVVHTSGDEDVFLEAKNAEKKSDDEYNDDENDMPQVRDGISLDVLEKLSSGISQKVRVRNVIDLSKDPAVARYEEGKITGWRMRQTEIEVAPEPMDVDDEDSEEEAFKDEKEPITKVIDEPVWRAVTNRGHIYWLTGPELMESLCRYEKWLSSTSGGGSNNTSYFEYDAAYLSYRNSIGRHCGRATEAAFASSPMAFARLMVKREQELYTKLKNRTYDNNWGGKCGARAAWTTSMRDYTFDFQASKDGLLTLENAFYELTGAVCGNATKVLSESDLAEDELPNGQDILNNPTTRDDIELESLDKEIRGLWNSLESRAVFREIVSSCKTTGFLGLALDLLCRNTTAFLNANKHLKVRNEPSYSTRTSSRKRNAWQQANQESW